MRGKFYLYLLALCLCASVVNFSCGSKPSDLRTLVPAETLIYLETKDLAAALWPIVDSKPFDEVAKRKPNLSALKGVQLAVAVTGFETSEEKLTDENSVGRVQPHFVAIADTHAWNFQAIAFAEQKLGSFVTDIYDSEPKLDKTEKNGGKYFTWTAKDGRKAFALVIDSVIYFGNDESAIDKCLSVKRGESGPFSETISDLPAATGETLAVGYVSSEGVAQVASLAALKFASDSSGASEVQSAVTSVLPQLIRNSVRDIRWTERKTDGGIEDTYSVSIPPELAGALNETLKPSGDLSRQKESIERLVGQIPGQFSTATRYNFKDPALAWRSVVFAAAKPLDARAGALVALVGNAVWEQYGVSEPEAFLSSLGNGNELPNNLITVRTGTEEEQTVVLAVYGDRESTRRSLVKDLKLDKQGEDGNSWWKSPDGELDVSFENGLVTMAPPDAMLPRSPNHSALELPSRLLNTTAPIATVGKDTESVLKLADLLAGEGHGETSAVSTYLTETRFSRSGMERKTTSDIGLIGWIIAEIASE